jgi:hypothetical protein
MGFANDFMPNNEHNNIDGKTCLIISFIIVILMGLISGK